MASYSKIILSGSTDGAGIMVTGTTPSGGNTIHTGVTGAAASLDEVWLYVHNTATSSREIGIQWGATAANARFKYTVTSRDVDGLHLIVPGLPIRNAKVIKAWATAADVLSIWGHVNRLAS
jgi:hypothetical protein